MGELFRGTIEVLFRGQRGIFMRAARDCHAGIFVPRNDGGTTTPRHETVLEYSDVKVRKKQIIGYG